MLKWNVYVAVAYPIVGSVFFPIIIVWPAYILYIVQLFNTTVGHAEMWHPDGFLYLLPKFALFFLVPTLYAILRNMWYLGNDTSEKQDRACFFESKPKRRVTTQGEFFTTYLASFFKGIPESDLQKDAAPQ